MKTQDLIEVQTPNCQVCFRTSQIRMPQDAYMRWVSGAMLQRAWPDGSPEEREMLITGLHPDCWDELVSDSK